MFKQSEWISSVKVQNVYPKYRVLYRYKIFIIPFDHPVLLSDFLINCWTPANQKIIIIRIICNLPTGKKKFLMATLFFLWVTFFMRKTLSCAIIILCLLSCHIKIEKKLLVNLISPPLIIIIIDSVVTAKNAYSPTWF